MAVDYSLSLAGLIPKLVVQVLENAAAIGLAQNERDLVRYEIELLISDVLGVSISWLYAHSDYCLSVVQQDKLAGFVRRRLDGEPLAYVIGKAEFYGLPLQVNRHVLVPRPETELLVDYVLDKYRIVTNKMVPASGVGLELGVGSGGLLAALARHMPDWCWHGVEIDLDTLGVARANLIANDLVVLGLEGGDGRKNDGALDSVGSPVTLYAGSWYQPLAQLANGLKFNLIVSNPPYLTDQELQDSKSGLGYEPARALSSGVTGLEAFAEIIAGAPAYLVAGGILVLEHAPWQDLQICTLLEAAGLTFVECIRDLNGLPRATISCY